MKLKNDINYAYQIFKQNMNTQKFILIFIFSILNGAIGAIAGINISYFESFIYSLNSEYYIMFFLFIIFINTKNIIDIFNQNYNYIIRCNSKKEYIKKLIITILINNLLIIILNLITLIICRNLFGTTGATYQIKTYTINPNIYLIFCLLKFIIIANVISISNTYLLLYFKYKFILIINCILYIYPIVSSNWIYGIDTPLKLPISPTYYLFSNSVNYTSFPLEILCFIIYISLWILLLKLFFNIIIKHIGDL